MHGINAVTATLFREAVPNESFRFTIYEGNFVSLSCLFFFKKNALKVVDDSTLMLRGLLATPA